MGVPRVLSLSTCITALSALSATTDAAVAGGSPFRFPLLSNDEVLLERRRRRRRLGDTMHGVLEGNSMPLGYFYTRVRIGTPGQEFTVIVDTGSTMLAVPCQGCSKCGTHQNPPFVPGKSSTFVMGLCRKKVIKNCPVCVRNRCVYRTNFVEGSVISGFLDKDMVTTAYPKRGKEVPKGDTPTSASIEALVGCQQEETGLFRAQLADGIIGLGYMQAGLNTLLDTLVATKHTPDTLTLCIQRDGGYLELGTKSPSTLNPGTIVADLMRHKKYYALRVLSLGLGNTIIPAPQSAYRSGRGVVLDSGTSLIYVPHAVYNHARVVLAKETKHLHLGPEEEIDGALCYKADDQKYPLGISMFPKLKIRFGRIGDSADETVHVLHPVHYMFLHPELRNPTHYCFGILDNGPSGTVLGALFMRHFKTTIDRDTEKVFFVPDECGDSLRTLDVDQVSGVEM